MDGLTVHEYAEQRKWDSWDDEEEAASLSINDAMRREGAHSAYLDILHFLEDAYRPEYLEGVRDRIARRKLTGHR